MLENAAVDRNGATDHQSSALYSDNGFDERRITAGAKARVEVTAMSSFLHGGRLRRTDENHVTDHRWSVESDDAPKPERLAGSEIDAIAQYAGSRDCERKCEKCEGPYRRSPPS
jgi:hypothetical protein